MARIPRILLILLLVVGAVAAVVAAIWLWKVRGAGMPADYGALTPMKRALTRLAVGHRGGQLAFVLGAAGVGALGAAFCVWRNWAWAHALVTLAAVAAIPGIWKIHGELAALEPEGFRGRSLYVAAMSRVANAGTLYFAILAGVAAAALAVVIVAKRRAAKAALAVVPPVAT